MSKPLVTNPGNIRLAMLGMVDGNGHPYSWSAIINGRYDAQVMADMYGAFGKLNAYGTTGSLAVAFEDTFYAFKAQLAAFVGYLRTGESPAPFAETVEMMKIIIAGVRSRENSGLTIRLDEIGSSVSCPRADDHE